MLPKGWEWSKLETFINEATDFVASGSFASLRENVKYYDEPKYAVLVRTKDFQSNFTKDLVYTDKQGYEFLSNSNLFGGELILPNIGASIGKVFIVPNLQERMTLAPNSIMIRCYKDTHKEWLQYLFLSPFGQEQLRIISSSTAQGKFNKTDLRTLNIPIPPLAEQERIVTEIKRWFTLIDEIEQSKFDLQNIISQTKSKILDLAIHGKLVPQNPNDEPAIELLKRINPDFTPCDIGHRRKLPQGWAYCQLSNVLKITMGQSPKGDSLNNKKGIEFHQGKICFSDKFLLDSGIYTNEPTKIVESNSILLCVRAPVGVVNITKKQICIGRGLCALTPFEGNADFYFYLLQTLQDRFDNQSTGTTFKAISREIIRNENIILPPLAEQQRIVQKIEELFHVLDNIQNALEV